MKAVILCAGYATRLYPLTFDKPKALLQVKGKPIIDYIIERIPEEIDEIVVVSNHKFYSQFLKWAEKYDCRVKIIDDGTETNETRLGGIIDLNLAVEHGINEDVLVILGDNLFDFDLRGFIEFFKNRKKTLLGIYKVTKEEAKRFGVVETQGEKIVSFEEKPVNPKSDTISTGLYIFTKNDLEELKKYSLGEGPKDAPGYLIKHLSCFQEVLCFSFKGRWFDIGTQDLYYRIKDNW